MAEPGLRQQISARLHESRLTASAELTTVDAFLDRHSRKEAASQIEVEHSRLVLGASAETLGELVAGVLSQWRQRKDAGDWTGYDAQALLCWALIAMRHRLELGSALA